MTISTPISGTVEPDFARVVEALAGQFEAGQHAGAALSVYHRGRPVVDVWGGAADAGTGRPWERTTIADMASTSKALGAVSVLQLVDRGLLDLDAPVARYWPEFAAAGKAGITVRLLLSHRSGVVALDRPSTVEDIIAGAPIAEAIAAQAPLWEPGTKHGYHGWTWGFAVSELIRRITGDTVGRYFAREIAVPLGLELHIGMPAAVESRFAPTVPPDDHGMVASEGMSDMLVALQDPTSIAYRANFDSLDVRYAESNDLRLLRPECVSASAVGSARGLARMFAATIGEVDGIRLLSPELVEQARTPEAVGYDQVLCQEHRWGLGFMLPGSAVSLMPDLGTRPFGHAGGSGSLAFADPEHELAFGFTPNRWAAFVDAEGDHRSSELVRAVYQVLGVREPATTG